MKHRRTPRFVKAFQALPAEVKAQARKAFLLFQENPQHSSLHIKRMRGIPGVWEGRVDIHYRFTFHYEGETVVFRNIGPHDMLDQNP